MHVRLAIIIYLYTKIILTKNKLKKMKRVKKKYLETV